MPDKKARQKPFGYWNKERVRREALKYTTRTEFAIKSCGAYTAALKKGWIDEVCSHMIVKWQKKWANYKICCEEAKKYKTRTAFQRECNGAYTYALRHGFLNEICSHMKLIWKRKWDSYEACQKESLKYKTRQAFQKGCDGAYTYALRHGFLDEICTHMEVVGNFYKRCIYAFEFPDKVVYVGLTGNIKRRVNQHLKGAKSPIYQYIKESGLFPELKILYDYSEKDIAPELEKRTLREYTDAGWKPLNKVKAGSLGGGTLRWEKEKCLDAAKKCNYRKEFHKRFSGAYYSCKQNGWLNELNEVLPISIVKVHKKEKISRIKWTKEMCREKSLQYQYKIDFKRYDGSAYTAAVRNGWLAEICTHMQHVPKKIKWTKEKCHEIALKYQTKKELKEKEYSVYVTIVRNKWVDNVCSHMHSLRSNGKK